MNTDTTERGLESLIYRSLAGDPNIGSQPGDSGDRPATYSRVRVGFTGTRMTMTANIVST